MILSIFTHTTILILHIGLIATLLLFNYIILKKLLIEPIGYLIKTPPKGDQMKPIHLENHIFNLDAIIMIEPYGDVGFVHCIDNHTYKISKAEYQQLLELLEKD